MHFDDWCLWTICKTSFCSMILQYCSAYCRLVYWSSFWIEVPCHVLYQGYFFIVRFISSLSFGFLFQCAVTLEYDIHQTPRLIDLLSRNWDKVLSHLRFTSRLQEFRFHMQEVGYISFSGCVLFHVYVVIRFSCFICS